MSSAPVDAGATLPETGASTNSACACVANALRRSVHSSPMVPIWSHKGTRGYRVKCAVGPDDDVLSRGTVGQHRDERDIGALDRARRRRGDDAAEFDEPSA